MLARALIWSGIADSIDIGGAVKWRGSCKCSIGGRKYGKITGIEEYACQVGFNKRGHERGKAGLAMAISAMVWVGGNSTSSMTWITPLVASTLAAITRELPLTSKTPN